MELMISGPCIVYLVWTSEKLGAELERFSVIEAPPIPQRHSKDDSQKVVAPDAINLIPELE